MSDGGATTITSECVCVNAICIAHTHTHGEHELCASVCILKSYRKTRAAACRKSSARANEGGIDAPTNDAPAERRFNVVQARARVRILGVRSMRDCVANIFVKYKYTGELKQRSECQFLIVFNVIFS